MGGLKPIIFGVFLCIAIAAFAKLTAPYLHISSTLLALLVGIVFSSFAKNEALNTGVNFSSSFILRLGIVLMGLSISFADIAALGWPVLLTILCGIVLILGLAILIARLTNLSDRLAVLAGGAVAICGASAAVAISTVLPNYKEKSRDLSLVILIVTAISTIEMLVYPFAAKMLDFNTQDIGIFLGAVIHDVAQTAGAGYMVSEDVGMLAVLTKMIRVSYILPVVLIALLASKTIFVKDHEYQNGTFKIPMFLTLFMLAIAANSYMPFPENTGEIAKTISKFALLTAIAAIGLKTDIKSITGAGAKPVLLISALALALAAFIFIALALWL